MSHFSIKQPKITPGFKPDGTPLDNDRIETGPTDRAFAEWAALGLEPPHLPTMRDYRLARVTSELQRRDLAGVLLFDPINIRYALDACNMMVWTLHNQSRAAFVTADGYTILWDLRGTPHLAAHLPNIDENRRGGAGFFYFEAGDMTAIVAKKFAQEIDDILRQHCGGNRRIAVDKMEIEGVALFDDLAIEIGHGQSLMEHARRIKGPDEIKAMRCAVAACEAGIAEMEAALESGIAENELWAILHHANIARGGEWIECRVLNSGPRTNPWMQEAGPRIIQDGDLVAFDTDLVGVYATCADISRTWLCGDGKPRDDQKRLYRIAHEQIQHNMALLKPGVSFTELTHSAYRLPEEFRAHRYPLMYHGIGMCDEFPCINYPEDYIEGAFEYELEPGMALCVEAFIGSEYGGEGVKLEDQVLITETGVENLTAYPFDQRLL